MIFRHLFLLLTPLMLIAGAKEQAERLLGFEYGDSAATFETLQIPPAVKGEIEKQAGQKFLKDFVYLWRVRGEQNSQALAIVDAVRGKSAFITALIVVNADATVERLSILDYSGERGREVTDSLWLAQFVGKTSHSEMSPGAGVDAVSGATISANAIARGVKRWCLLAEYLTAQTAP